MSRRRSLLLQAAGSSWTPADVTTLGWWDASDASTFTYSSGTVVSEWADKSGNDYHFAQGTVGSQPGRTGTQNGLSTVVFDGTDDEMSAGTAANWIPLHDGTTWIMGIAWQTTNANPDKLLEILTTAQIAANRVGFVVAYDDRSSVPRNDRMLLYVVRGSAPPAIDGVLSSEDAFDAATFGCTTILCDPDNATAADRGFVYTNNTLVSSSETSTSTPSTGSPFRALRLMGVSTTGEIDGVEVGEIVIISGADATASNRVELDTYLRNKWGI